MKTIEIFSSKNSFFIFIKVIVHKSSISFEISADISVDDNHNTISTQDCIHSTSLLISFVDDLEELIRCSMLQMKSR